MLEGRNWYKMVGATSDEIEFLIEKFKQDLPDGLVELLNYSNGGEGSLPVQPYNFVLDSIAVLIETNSANQIKEQFPDYFIFGGNGGGEYFACQCSTGVVCILDMCNTDIAESRQIVSKSFREFIELIGHDGE